jgi:glycosyltransferase involved in cell wall biosynthesis
MRRKSSLMKIYINRMPVRGPWGGGNHFVKAFVEMVPDMGHEIVNPADYSAKPDVILCVGLANDGQCIGIEQAIMYKMMNPEVKIVLRVNENDARKGTSDVDRKLISVSEHIDATVFVSDWMWEYFHKKGWKCKQNEPIINGCDPEIFKPGEKLDNGKVNIVAHHWSDNALKGADVYEAVDEFVGKNPDKFTFTYIGRTRSQFKHSKVIRPIHGKKLGEELGRYDVYVSGSRHDPGPNHVIEALACGLPTLVHRDGGGCVEFAGEDHRFCDVKDLMGVLAATSVKPIEPNTAFYPVPWEDCIAEYVKYLERITNA